MPRKRTHDEMAASEPPQVLVEQSMIQKLRNMWEFACVMQFIYMFGKVVKIDEDFDIEVRNDPSADLYGTPKHGGGVFLMHGMANLMHPGLRNGMHEAHLLRKIRGNRPDPSQMDLVTSRTRV